MKKFSALIICLLFIIACTFSGCAGFYRNEIKYQNRVVIKVGDYEITQFDLDAAYNNGGYAQYVNIGYMTEEDARKQVEESLINGQLLYKEIKDNKTYQPTAYQLNEIARNIIDNVNSQMETYLSTARKILKVQVEEEKEETSEEETLYSPEKYQKYSHRANLVQYQETVKGEGETADKIVTKYRIEYNPDKFPTPVLENAIIDKQLLEDLSSHIFDTTILNKYIIAIKNKFLQQFNESLKDEKVKIGNSYLPVGDKVADKALSLLVDDLINYEYYMRAENPKQYTLSNDDLLFRFFKRNVDGQLQNQFITNLRNDYLSTHTDELSPELLLSTWENIIRFNKQYDIDQEGYKDKIKAISTDGDTVLYHPNLTDGTKFGYFIHALLTSEEFTKEVEKINDEYPETDKEHKEIRQNKLNEALSLIKINARDLTTGKKQANATELSQIMQDYNDVAKLTNYNARLSAFINFMFKYSSDPGLLSGGMPYVVGTNGNSNMNEPFTKEALNLMNGTTGNKITALSKYDGNMSIFTKASKYDDLCIAYNGDGSYGIHLIMYIGDVGKFDVDTSSLTLDSLKETINPLTKETYFDMLFDKVYPATSDSVLYSSKNGYSAYEETLISLSEQKNKIVYC